MKNIRTTSKVLLTHTSFARVFWALGVTLVSSGWAGAFQEVPTPQSSPTRLESLQISPDSVAIPLGLTQQLIVTGRFRDGTLRDVTNLVTWVVSAPSVVQVMNGGILLTIGTGLVTVTARAGLVTAEASVSVTTPSLEAKLHDPLPEQYIWSGDSQSPDQTCFFRAEFPIKRVPKVATLYIAGPSNIEAYLNGKLVVKASKSAESLTKPFVLVEDVSSFLQLGQNLLALAGSNGNSVVAKLVPAPPGVNDPALVISDQSWKVTVTAEPGWMQPSYNASHWLSPTSLGGVESNDELTQGALDSEMYRWAGYDGLASFLARHSISARDVLDASDGGGQLGSLAPLTQPSSAGPFFVVMAKTATSDRDYPSLILDFGREISGRLEVESEAASSAKIRLRYGESLQEAIVEPYYGENELDVPPRTTVYGPKSGFRYVEVKFVSGPPVLILRTLRAEEIFYPVSYQGSFDSSDPLLNRIWSTAARTAHLTMQNGVWDGIKRDRMKWMGDFFVSDRVIQSVFGDRMLTKVMLDFFPAKSLGPTGFINNIPGYSAFWLRGLADYYRYSGDLDFLTAHHDQVSSVLGNMKNSVDATGLFGFDSTVLPFVDWSPDFFTDSFESRAATEFEFYGAFLDGAWLLEELRDKSEADDARMTAALIRSAAQRLLLNSASNTFGNRWQTNAAAIFSGICDAEETADIWAQVLSVPSSQPVTPYYNYFVLKAMARAGHRREALNWMRAYWGGMLAEGATSFWEAYDLTWPKDNFHAFLQADRTEGYYVSLAHGWSSGPAAWIMEEVLGIRPITSGFEQASIRPDLVDLQWAHGSEPSPYGPIAVNYEAAGETLVGEIILPDGVEALLSLPISDGQKSVLINGLPTQGIETESGSRLVVILSHGGKYEFRTIRK